MALLLDIWKTQPDEIRAKTVQQILSIAGDGKLRDDGKTSAELRSFLDQIDSHLLLKFADQCLTSAFSESGMVLQDIVNQIGKRLGFVVEFGRYRGIKSQIGNDGLWTTKGGDALIVEVKTTDAYQIPLETPVGYRRKLIEAGKIGEASSSILYVVGRSNTGDFESQVRGSCHAWDIRLIGIEALASLLKIRETVDDPAILEKIRSILKPTEYTRVDRIIDLVFTTTSEAKKDEEVFQDVAGPQTGEPTKRITPVNFREACFERIARDLKITLVKQSPAISATPDGFIGVYCANSRAYQNPGGSGYWFGFHPGQRDALAQYEKAFVGFGCGSPENILLIPFAEFQQWLPTFNQTILPDRAYWHVKFDELKGQWFNTPKAEHPRRPVTKYLVLDKIG